MQPPGAASFERALYYERNGKPDAALAAYLQALEEAPDDLEIAYRTASALLRAGHLDEALSQLRRIVFVAPDHHQARASLGNCQYLLGDMTNAENNFRTVLDALPDNRNALYGLASILVDQGRDSQALAPAERLVGLMPDNADVRTLHARALSHDVQASAAIAAYRRALELDRGHLPAMLGLARLYLKRRRYDEAAVLAAQAASHAAKSIEPLQVLADARTLGGDYDGAQAALHQALSICTPDQQADLLLRLSTCLRKAGQPEAALVEAFQAYQLAPQDSGVLNALGTCLAGLKQGAMARAVLTAASSGSDLDEGLKARIARAAADAEQATAPDLPDAVSPDGSAPLARDADPEHAPDAPVEMQTEPAPDVAAEPAQDQAGAPDTPPWETEADLEAQLEAEAGYAEAADEQDPRS